MHCALELPVSTALALGTPIISSPNSNGIVTELLAPAANTSALRCAQTVSLQTSQQSVPAWSTAKRITPASFAT